MKNAFCLLLVATFIHFIYSDIYAQDDCTNTLSKAQKLFDAGMIEQIPQMLQPCIERGFTNEENLQAQKLIIASYLFGGDKNEADKAMLAFLKNFPEYEVTSSDQAEFVQLFNTYRTLPIASIGVILGSSSTAPVVSSVYENGKAGSYKSSGFNFHAGLSYRQHLINKFEINIEPQLWGIKRIIQHGNI